MLVLAKLPLLKLLKLVALALRQLVLLAEAAAFRLLLLVPVIMRELVLRCELSDETEVPFCEWLPADWFVLTVFVLEFSDKESSFLTASGEWVPAIERKESRPD